MEAETEPIAVRETEAGTVAKAGPEVEMREREEEGQHNGRLEAQGTGSGEKPAPHAAEEPTRKGISNGYVAKPGAPESDQRGRSWKV